MQKNVVVVDIGMYRELGKVANFVNCLADEDGIDPNLVSLLGFSAGAYAVTELLTSSDIHLISFRYVCFTCSRS